MYQPSTLTYFDLNIEQKEWFDHFSADSLLKSISIVQVGNLLTSQQDGSFEFQHPTKSCSVFFKSKFVEFSPDGNYYWYGVVPDPEIPNEIDCDCVEGTININFNSSGYYIQVSIDHEDVFFIEPLGGGIHVLLEYYDSESLLVCGNEFSLEDISDFSEYSLVEPLIEEVRNSSFCPVRVLAFYTTNAKECRKNIIEIVNSSISYTNQALRNSNVHNLKFELVATLPIPNDWTEGNVIHNDISELVTWMYSNGPIDSIRQYYYADIVVVYTDGGYKDNKGEYQGITYAPLSYLGISLIEVGEKKSISKTTAHEIGHILFCEHGSGPYNPNWQPTWNRAHAFSTGEGLCKKSRLTILNSNAPSRNFIQHYSDPEVYFKGKRTGDHINLPNNKGRINARQLREQACNVAMFIQEPFELLNLHIAGERFACPCNTVTLVAGFNIVEVGQYQIEWRVSNDGINWSQVISNLSSFNLQVSCQVGDGTFVQLRVVTPSGQAYVVTAYIEPIPDPYDFPCPRASELNSIITNTMNSTILIYPNPASDIVFLMRKKTDIYSVDHIQILDIYGKSYFNSEMYLYNPIEVNISTWSDGMYIIKTNQYEITRFIKQSK